MVSISSMRDGSVRAAVKQVMQSTGPINEAGVKAIAIAAGDGGAISKTERKDLEKLLRTASLEPNARKLLQDFLASPQANAPAPTNVPLAQRTNPAFAFFGMQNVPPGGGTTPGTGGAGGTGGVQGTTPAPEPQRPRTLPPPAVIASTAQSNQTTGPDRRPLNFPANALVQLWAVPGSTIRIYNNSVLENGKPKLLKEMVAPMSSNDTGPRCMTGAYPTMEAFKEAAGAFMAAPHDGMILVSVPMDPNDDQDARDTLKVTQQSGSRGESNPVSVRMHSYDAFPRVDREPAVDKARVSVANGVLTTQGDFALTPGTFVQAIKDGVRTNVHASADENGRLSLDLSSLGTSSNVVLVTSTYKGRTVPLDLSAQGLGGSLPPVQDRLAKLDNAITRGFMQAPVDGKLRFEVPGLLDGAALEVRSAANPGQVQTFVASGGKLVVDLEDVWDGDALSVRLDLSRVPDTFADECFRDGDPHTLALEGSDGRARFSTKASFLLPTAAQAARAQQVLEAFPNARAQDLGLALDIFGPYSKVGGGQAVTDPARMRDIVAGAKLGSSLPPHWETNVKGHVAVYGSRGLQEGVALGMAWGRATGVSLGQGLEKVGFEAVRDPGAHYSTPPMYTLRLPGVPDLTRLDPRNGWQGYPSGPRALYNDEARAMDNPQASAFVFTLPA